MVVTWSYIRAETMVVTAEEEVEAGERKRNDRVPHRVEITANTSLRCHD